MASKRGSVGILAGAALLTFASAQAQQAPLPPPAVPPEKSAKPLASVPLLNAGFESTKPGKLGAPEGWWAVQHAGPHSYNFTLDTQHPRSGERSLKLENVGPEPFGTIYQAIDATPHRHKTLRFAAWIRTEGTTGNQYGSGAGIKLHSLRGGYMLDYTQMRKDAVQGTTDWTRYEISLKVPGNADQIEVGMNLFGKGTAWLDDAVLDVIEPVKTSAP